MATRSAGRLQRVGWVVFVATVLGAGAFLLVFSEVANAPIRHGRPALATARAELGPAGPTTPSAPTARSSPTPGVGRPGVGSTTEADERYRQGAAHYQERRYAEAIPHFKRTVTLDPQRASAWRYLGWCYYLTEQYEEALEPFRQAARLQPENADSLVGIGWASYGLKRYDQARDAFRRALALAPGSPSAQSGLKALEQRDGTAR